MVRAQILVVEDERLVALDIRQSLLEGGHEAVLAHSGEEAIGKVDEHSFDLILMDIKLRGKLDGIEAAHLIHASQDIPLVYLTAYADNATLERARLTAPYGYLLKPFQERELKATAEMILHRRRAELQRIETQRARHCFLAESAVELGEAFDSHTLIRRACELLVPDHADWCAIHAAQYSNIPSTVVIRSKGQTSVSEGNEPTSLMRSVERSATFELVTGIIDPRILVADGPRLATFRALEPRSCICVPLRTPLHVIGSIAVATGRERRPFTVANVNFFEEFADGVRVALGRVFAARTAQHAIRLRGQLLSRVAHDVLEPIAAAGVTHEATIEDGVFDAARRINAEIGKLLATT